MAPPVCSWCLVLLLFNDISKLFFPKRAWFGGVNLCGAIKINWDGARLFITAQLSPHVLEFTRRMGWTRGSEPKTSARPSWPPVEQWSPQLEHYQVPLTTPFFYWIQHPCRQWVIGGEIGRHGHPRSPNGVLLLGFCVHNKHHVWAFGCPPVHVSPEHEAGGRSSSTLALLRPLGTVDMECLVTDPELGGGHQK